MTPQEQWKEEFEKHFCEDPKNPIYPSMRYWKNWNRDWNMIPTVSNVEWFIETLLAAQRAETVKKTKALAATIYSGDFFEKYPFEEDFVALLSEKGK